MISLSTPESGYQNIHDLIERILPGHSDQFRIGSLPAEEGREIFELSSENGRIVIKGTDALAITKGFNHYLNHYGNIRVSWYAADPVPVLKELPLVETVIRKEARFKKRFFLNYCTFGYTMVWWQWHDWERFIDWMALNGINMPLAITGQEAIWLEVWQEFGMTEDQIRAYFTGPAHLPWHRMGNLDSWLGPLPQEFIDHQFALQKRILERERSFGMTPVLPAFAGHIPKAIKEQHPEANITNMGSYTVGEGYEAFFLDPMDPLFLEIQRKFLEAQTRHFGTDHYYGADPFNEMDPPSTEPEYLASVSKTIYQGMNDVDPEARWVQMGWTFYYMKLWKEDPERLKAMIQAVPEDRMIILDYFAEKEEVWRNTDAWHGAPYIWSYLGNFGNNSEMAAPIHEVAQRLVKTEDAPDHGKLYGIGSTLEGFGVNRFMFEWLFEYVWDKGVADVDKWVTRYAESKTKHRDPVAEEAYHRLFKLVYNDQVSGIGAGSMMHARPRLTGVKGYHRSSIYDYKELTDILTQMLSGDAQSLQSPEYQKDLVVVTKQILDNLILPVRKKLNEAYEAQDVAELEKQISTFLGILDDQEKLLATQPEFLLGKWIADARAFGNDPASKDYYEKNARVLITTWGNEGNRIIDYASSARNGTLSTYYKARWEQFFDRLRDNLKTGNTDIDQDAIDKEMAAFEWNWTDQRQQFISTPEGDALELVREIHDKHRPLFDIANY